MDDDDTPREYDREFTTPLTYRTRRRIGYSHDRGDVTRFVVQLEYRLDEGWAEVVRFDGRLSRLKGLPATCFALLPLSLFLVFALGLFNLGGRIVRVGVSTGQFGCLCRCGVGHSTSAVSSGARHFRCPFSLVFVAGDDRQGVLLFVIAVALVEILLQPLGDGGL